MTANPAEAAAAAAGAGKRRRKRLDGRNGQMQKDEEREE